MSNKLKLHKFHIKNLNKTDKRAIGFVESIEEINIPEHIEQYINDKIIKNKLFEELIENESKNKKLLKLFSILKLSNMQSFFNAVDLDRENLYKAIKIVNKETESDADFENMIDRIVVVHKISIIKQIFSEQRISSAEESITKHK